MVLNTLLLTAAFFATIYWQSSIPLFIGAVFALSQWLLQRHLQPPLALSAEQMARARKAHGWELLLVFLYVFWQ
ncbi:MAG: hypothetical protein ACR2JA_06070 [Hydrogenophaga sp.]|uniref:hypothetical protein n=1 Tax=Hydrogenophaga sp. TaxID=1904254 RepID=UPI003D9AD75E